MLRARVITALILLVGLLAGLFLLPAPLWLAFASLVCAIGSAEWAGMTGFAPRAGKVYALLVGALCFAAGGVAGLHRPETIAPFGLIPVYVVSALFWIFCVPLWLRAKWRLPSPAAGALVGLVLLLPPALAMAHLRLLSPWLLLGVMAAVWVADIAAYFTGRAFGRRKLAPGISPGKSWEGAYGAVVGVVIYGVVVISSLGQGAAAVSYPAAVPALIAFTALSIIGDLFESLVKRQAGVKDSGSLLPGHGGVLDRIDSLTSTLPVAGLLLLWMAH